MASVSQPLSQKETRKILRTFLVRQKMMKSIHSHSKIILTAPRTKNLKNSSGLIWFQMKMEITRLFWQIWTLWQLTYIWKSMRRVDWVRRSCCSLISLLIWRIILTYWVYFDIISRYFISSDMFLLSLSNLKYKATYLFFIAWQRSSRLSIFSSFKLRFALKVDIIC